MEALLEEYYEKGRKSGRKQGMMKVVKWVKSHQMPDTPNSDPYPGLVLISKVELEAFLNENGLIETSGEKYAKIESSKD